VINHSSCLVVNSSKRSGDYVYQTVQNISLHANSLKHIVCLKKLIPVQLVKKSPSLVNYRYHKNQPTDPVLSQMNSVTPSKPVSLKSVLILSSHLRLCLTSSLFLSCSPTEISYEFVPCARYFSYEATIYESGLLDMRILPVSYPHPFPTSFPALGCSSELETTTVQIFVRETSLGIRFGFLF
jgi:hypothetical protein